MRHQAAVDIELCPRNAVMSSGRNSLRNLRREAIFRPYAESVFVPKLGGQQAFDSFYDQLTNQDKDLFLGAAAKYVLLLRDGDWHVTRDDCNPVIDYLTNSFKLVSLFSLIESLSVEKHEDFYEWLRQREDATFAISDKSTLKLMYEEYKLTYGFIRRCVKFFERMPAERQVELRSGLTVRGKPVPEIKAVAEFLYNLRSKFVHECEFVLDIATVPVMSRHKNAVTVTKMSIPCLMRGFEDGLLAYFRRAT